MKKIIMILLSGVFYTLLITSNATAQRATNITFPIPGTDNKNGSAGDDKIVAGNAIDPAAKAAIKDMEANLKAAKVTLKVTSHLSKNFKNVSGLTWNTEEKAIIASFKMDDKSARVVYNKRGNWLFTIINYSEEQMPREVRSLVKDSYGEFTITLVQEVRQGGITLYKVHLEDNTHIKQVLVYNGEITVYGDFIKSK